MSLNREQAAAVHHVHGPLLILAGAGSGKTRVITHRVAHLIDIGVAPENILAVSFTNKAAGEMRERVAGLVGSRIAKQTNLSTFHALGAQLLRQYIDRIGYRRPFTILDVGDQTKVMREVLEQEGFDRKEIKAQDVLQVVSRAKNAFCQPKALKSMRFNPMVTYAQKLFRPYMDACRGLNAVDFDDLQTLPVKLFHEHQDVLRECRERYQFVMVDEYQDTNDTQLRVLKLLCAPKYNLCVVGDDDQAIYSFRGAVTRNILEFEKHFKGAKVIKLQQNYRSTSTILKSANAVVRNNTKRRDKALWSALGEGEKLEYYEMKDEVEEADFVISAIERQGRGGGSPWSDFAILMRTTRTSQYFEEALSANEIPFRMIGGTKFYDKREVKDLVSYLKVILNPRDEVALRRVLNTPPRGIGHTTLGRLSDAALERKVPLIDVVANPAGVAGLRRGHLAALAEFHGLLAKYRARFKNESLGETGAALVEELHFKDYIRESEKSEIITRIRLENLGRALESMANHESARGNDLEGFVSKASLADSFEKGGEEASEDVVTLMSLHASKGLEYPRVFLVGFEEGMLPHARSVEPGGDGDVEEERRLLYVGITRAQHKLILTSARVRGRGHASKPRTVSRYLAEIPPEFIDVHRHGEYAPPVQSVRKSRFQQLKALLEEQ